MACSMAEWAGASGSAKAGQRMQAWKFGAPCNGTADVMTNCQGRISQALYRTHRPWAWT
jgi:hypothetical protein